jgi:hypothetical protein
LAETIKVALRTTHKALISKVNLILEKQVGLRRKPKGRKTKGARDFNGLGLVLITV